MNVSDAALEDDASRIEIDSRAANNAFMDGLPVELKAILLVVWNRRISPFGVCRIAGEKFMKAVEEGGHSSMNVEEAKKLLSQAYEFPHVLECIHYYYFELLCGGVDQIKRLG